MRSGWSPFNPRRQLLRVASLTAAPMALSCRRGSTGAKAPSRPPVPPPPPTAQERPLGMADTEGWEELMFFDVVISHAPSQPVKSEVGETSNSPADEGAPLGIGEAMSSAAAAADMSSCDATAWGAPHNSIAPTVGAGKVAAAEERGAEERTTPDGGDDPRPSSAPRKETLEKRGADKGLRRYRDAQRAAGGSGGGRRATRRKRSSRELLVGDCVTDDAAGAAPLSAAVWPYGTPARDPLADVEGEGFFFFPSQEGGEAEEEAIGGRSVEVGGAPPPPPRCTADEGGSVPAGQQRAEPSASPPLVAPPPFPPITARMASVRHSFLAQQDALYLAPETPLAAQAPSPSSLQGRRQCVMVVFAANDLRVHDNYSLALASVRARTAGGLPVVGVCVLDYRTFAQPSVVGGFFRQSPMRASFLLANVAALRRKLEEEYRVPLLIRVGRQEEHVPRLAVELGAVDVFLTTQYAPHERRVHDATVSAVRRGRWVGRRALRGSELATPQRQQRLSGKTGHNDGDGNGGVEVVDNGEEEEDVLVRVEQHDASKGDLAHPYGGPFAKDRQTAIAAAGGSLNAVPHSVWQSTLVHLDDLPTPVAAMKEGERWYHDDVTVATIRPTRPYDLQAGRLRDLPCWHELLPSRSASEEVNAVVRGRVPSLFDLGYALAGRDVDLARLLTTEEIIATQSSHPAAGEDAAVAHVTTWLADGGLTSMLRYGRPRRTNTKMYSQRLSRVSPYLSVGALSARKFYELLRGFAHEQLRDGFVQMQYREALLRLSRRDYWHWMGLRFGDRLFFSYGPHPDTTDDVPDWRRDPKITQKWCLGLTGIPFADAAMKELVTTGYVASEGRQALIWLLTQGYGQDWRLGAEWLERCSLDYDPFLCYGNAAYYGRLIKDDFGETVRNAHYLAHRHDQTGIYIKKWLPQLSKVPPVYIHRPHVMTPRMQAMHGVVLGRNYPFPLKLWDGAQHTLGAASLSSYFAGDGLTAPVSRPADAASVGGGVSDRNHKTGPAVGPGYAEAVRCGVALMEPEELHAAVRPTYIVRRPWAQAFLPETMLAAIGGGEEEGLEGGDGVLVPAASASAQRLKRQALVEE